MSFQRRSTEPEFKSKPVETIHVFRHLDPSAPIVLPEKASNRKCTDIAFLIVFVLCQIILIVSSTYFVWVSDPKITELGEDGCGNTCGIKNVVKYNETCPLEDYTDYPLELFTSETCVSRKECEEMDMVVYYIYCYIKLEPNLTEEEANAIKLLISMEDSEPYLKIIYFVLTPIVASVFSIAVFGLFKWDAFFAFYFFAIFTSILFILAVPGLWYLIYYLVTTKGFLNRAVWLVYVLTIFCTLISISLPILLFFRRRKTKFLIQIYREMIPAIFKSNFMLFLPMLAVITIMILGFVWMILFEHALSVKIPENSSLPAGRLVYMVFLGFMAYWIFLFALHCQGMIASGAVAGYYFARDKDSLKNQYLKYSGIVVRYHLGTVAAVSLVIVVIKGIKMIIHSLRDHEFEAIEIALNVLCHCIEEFLHYISTKAYIMTAIHGKNFLKSGKRAIRMMWIHFLDLIQVDGFNLVALFSAGVTIISICLSVTYTILNDEHRYVIWFALIVTAASATVTLIFFFTLISVSISTLFLCYCEDRHLNDDSDQPYFMSQELATAVSEALEFAAIRRAEKAHQLRQRSRHNQQSNSQIVQ
ncbi:choline transporter-like protein 1 [Tribolium madens]|uniref:choline transporter-like protein 1 n=1 Tax=Tribolium madens TaxID=41895 RepID=UPI001CF733B5|nr:choline transporter-like protein 1 [Tribolium madens]